MNFLKCPTCSGSPTLCDSCLNNRQSISRLKTKLAAAREEICDLEEKLFVIQNHHPHSAELFATAFVAGKKEGEGERDTIKAKIAEAEEKLARANEKLSAMAAPAVQGVLARMAAPLDQQRAMEDMRKNLEILDHVKAERDKLRSDLLAALVWTEKMREALKMAERYMTTTHGCVCKCPVIDGHTGDCPVISALWEWRAEAGGRIKLELAERAWVAAWRRRGICGGLNDNLQMCESEWLSSDLRRELEKEGKE